MRLKAPSKLKSNRSKMVEYQDHDYAQNQLIQKIKRMIEMKNYLKKTQEDNQTNLYVTFSTCTQQDIL